MYKGFKITDKKLMCRDFEYKEGETYEIDKANEIKLCKKGFHACENPLDCFAYYLPATSVYHEVELAELSQEISTDSKRVGAKITIGKLLDIPSIIDAVINLRVQSALRGGHESALQGGHESALQGGNRSALRGGNRSALRGGDWSALQGGGRSALQGGHESTLQGGYESALQGGYESALQGGDWSALQGGSRSALRGGHGSALQGGHESALQGGHGSALRGGHGSALQGGHGSALQGGEGSALQGGDKSVVYGQGNTCKVKGGILSVLAILYTYANGDQAVEHTIVDGEKIKANTWYMYDGEEFIETSLG